MLEETFPHYHCYLLASEGGYFFGGRFSVDISISRYFLFWRSGGGNLYIEGGWVFVVDTAETGKGRRGRGRIAGRGGDIGAWSAVYVLLEGCKVRPETGNRRQEIQFDSCIVYDDGIRIQTF